MWRQRVRAIFNRKAGDLVTDSASSSDNGVWLVVGLGNPGPSYAGHRHNVGYLVADELASRMGSAFRPHKSGRADVVEGRLGGTGGVGGVRVVLARPRCYMNETGGPVSTLAKFYKVPIEQVVAIHDELEVQPCRLPVVVSPATLAALERAAVGPDSDRLASAVAA